MHVHLDGRHVCVDQEQGTCMHVQLDDKHVCVSKQNIHVCTYIWISTHVLPIPHFECASCIGVFPDPLLPHKHTRPTARQSPHRPAVMA